MNTGWWPDQAGWHFRHPQPLEAPIGPHLAQERYRNRFQSLLWLACRLREDCGIAAGGDQELSQIWVGQTAPVTNPYARCPEGVVGLSKFCTLGWAPHDHTVRPVQM